ncbi:MAG: hypothetical protein Q4E22_05675 [Coriobacteriia bacterium]|nr:hypothetical protein [Coriobacteriia bacterium]
MQPEKSQAQGLPHTKRPKRYTFSRIHVLLLSLALVALGIGGTLAYLVTKTNASVNTFLPAQVSCEVIEVFDGRYKTNVNVQNTSDTDAYIRVKLVSYRVNESGQHIGGLAPINDFAIGENWKLFGEYYYYTLPIQANQQAAENLTNSIELTESYDDADGGKQVIEVMAEAIQDAPAKAVGESWGVTISEGSVAAYPTP